MTGLRLEQENDPVARLRGQVISVAANPRLPLSPSQVLGLFVLAWNVKRGGKRLPKRNFQVPQRTAPRPKIDGFPEHLFVTGQLAFPYEDDDDDAV